MSHYNALVLIGKDITDIKAEVTRIIQPYFSDREPTDVPRVWDWWRIGGWWDGLLMLDRKTWEESQCAICAGNGRDAIHHHYTVAHEQLDRNVCEVAQLPEDTHVYSLWCEDAFLSTGYHLGSCAECFAYFNDDDVGYEVWQEHKKTHGWDKPDQIWIPEMRQFLVEYGQGKLAVCIDYHN